MNDGLKSTFYFPKGSQHSNGPYSQIHSGSIWLHLGNYGWWHHRRYMAVSWVRDFTVCWPHDYFCSYLVRPPLTRRGLPMSFFAVAAVGGTGFGPIYAGWVEMNPRLQWRWIQWIQMMYVTYLRTYFDLESLPSHIFSITGFYLVLVPLIMKETRSSIILMRIAKRMRKETGNPRYRARIEDEGVKLSTLIWVSCTRPIRESTPK